MNQSSSRKRTNRGDHGFKDIMFSWSLEDIFNEDLYKDKVKSLILHHYHFYFDSLGIIYSYYHHYFISELVVGLALH